MITLKAEPVHRLGAIELIELGDSRGAAPTMRRPFMMGRRTFTGGIPTRPMQMGQLDFLGNIGSFLAGAFSAIFNGIASFIEVPLGLLSNGTGILFDGVAGLLANIPIVGMFASQLVLVGKAVIQWGLSVPGLLLRGVGNIFGEIKDAIDATLTSDEKKENETEGKKKILDDAEAMGGKDFKDAVQNVLNGETPDGTGTPPNTAPPNSDDVGNPNTDPDSSSNGGGNGGTGVKGSDLADVLKIGLPIAAAGTLVFFALS